jgi:hypothetical protein
VVELLRLLFLPFNTARRLRLKRNFDMSGSVSPEPRKAIVLRGVIHNVPGNIKVLEWTPGAALRTVAIPIITTADLASAQHIPHKTEDPQPETNGKVNVQSAQCK